ncbi:MAG: RelA/SpoT domain-containing protein [Kiritimatiellae bacterium]|nr:RelA/SpoT domain-containing protein [Kiritimatiellia bacterium]
MPLDANTIEQAVERYFREVDRYAKLSEFVGEACRKVLEDNALRGSVQWRAKAPERLRLKLQKQLARGDHAAEFKDVGSVFTVMKDLAGVRVTTYVEADRGKVVELVGKRFAGVVEGGSVVPERKDTNDNFYRATHCVVKLKPTDLVGRYQNLADLGCEVQVCSLLAHVYNEIEHDLRYKPLTGTLSDDENALLNALGHLTASGDTVINQTLNAAAARMRTNTAEFEDVHDFVVRMRVLLPDASNFSVNAGQLYEVCKALGLDSPDCIKQALAWTDETPGQARTLADRLAARVNTNERIQLEVDPLSSDQVLLLVLSDAARVQKLREIYPSGRGIGRAPRFLSVAKQLESLQGEA